jgi:ankyrin repeat protein
MSAWRSRLALAVVVGLCAFCVITFLRIKRQADEDRRGHELIEAIERADLRAVGQILDAGVSPNYLYPDNSAESRGPIKTAFRRPIINLASYHGRREIIQLLIEHGATVNGRDQNGSTALMWAAQQGHFEVIKILLAAGAQVDARDWNGDTALMRALYSGNPATLKLLLDAGARSDIRDKDGQTALTLAKQYGQKPMIDLLVGRNGKPWRASKANHGR